VQGYNFDALPVGEPGNQLGTFNWPGTGQPVKYIDFLV